jgi:hypothetical protein
MELEMEAQGRAIQQAVTIAQVSLVALQHAKASNLIVGHTVGSFKTASRSNSTFKFTWGFSRDKNIFFKLYTRWVLFNMNHLLISLQR